MMIGSPSAIDERVHGSWNYFFFFFVPDNDSDRGGPLGVFDL